MVPSGSDIAGRCFVLANLDSIGNEGNPRGSAAIAAATSFEKCGAIQQQSIMRS